MGRHAFLIAGTHSGCGKTTISLALMAALRRGGLAVQPFKVGPDFIDPGFHGQVSGRDSRNLDGWMLSRRTNEGLFRGLLRRADVAVVEGVMGLFDGYDGLTESGSSAEMAKWLGIPVILVVDARSMARSAAALVHGFSRFDPGLRVCGVIFNRIGSPGHLSFLKDAMAANLPEIPVLGGIPRQDGLTIPERHLGLVTSDEILLDRSWQDAAANLVESCIDMDGLLAATVHPEDDAESGSSPADAPSPINRPVPIAVARDSAFCFYYADNLDLLRRAGAEIRFFSPLAGDVLPADAAGLYLGGGYPELFAAELSSWAASLESIRSAAAAGMPIYAECGGMMFLGRDIETMEGARHPMAGVLPFGTRMLKRRKALGYTEVELLRPCLLGPAGLRLRGHEFHYSEIAPTGDEGGSSMAGRGVPEQVYLLRGKKAGETRREGYLAGSVLASYIHLHWGSAPEAAASFVQHCREFDQ
ncbi:MAG: cobyrinate a,c-diamide synthase [Syntrophobacteraceae bacterium]|nr:cobyrinate a,c-diamide synthase [Syntrophobacteraceae bacterium]